MRREVLLRAENVAKLDIGAGPLRLLGRHLLELGDGLVGALEGVED